jgi:hypothetical protein
MSDDTKKSEGEMEESEFIVVNGRKLHPASLPGLMELDPDGDLLFYISPSLIRLRAMWEVEEKRRAKEQET